MDAQMRTRGFTKWCWGAALLAVSGALWLGIRPPAPAYAQVPDSGAQRLEMIKELQTTNASLAEIAGLLREIRDDARKARDASAKPKQP